MFDISRLCFFICPIKCLRRWRWTGKIPTQYWYFVRWELFLSFSSPLPLSSSSSPLLSSSSASTLSSILALLCYLHWELVFCIDFIRYLEDQAMDLRAPSTALEELRTRPTMHRKHLMECSTGSSRWKILKQMNDDIIQNWRTIFLSNSSHQWCLQARFTAFVVNVKKF